MYTYVIRPYLITPNHLIFHFNCIFCIHLFSLIYKCMLFCDILSKNNVVFENIQFILSLWQKVFFSFSTETNLHSTFNNHQNALICVNNIRFILISAYLFFIAGPTTINAVFSIINRWNIELSFYKYIRNSPWIAQAVNVSPNVIFYLKPIVLAV